MYRHAHYDLDFILFQQKSVIKHKKRECYSQVPWLSSDTCYSSGNAEMEIAQFFWVIDRY